MCMYYISQYMYILHCLTITLYHVKTNNENDTCSIATESDIHADLAAYNKPTVVMVAIVVPIYETHFSSSNQQEINIIG